ncbi:MAG: hypothetical protein NXY57DRAFT_973455, partial [Lentinula lateritia]
VFTPSIPFSFLCRQAGLVLIALLTQPNLYSHSTSLPQCVSHLHLSCSSSSQPSSPFSRPRLPQFLVPKLVLLNNLSRSSLELFQNRDQLLLRGCTPGISTLTFVLRLLSIAQSQ